MSIISLDYKTIESLNDEITSLDTVLLQTYFPNLADELNLIYNNVQGDEIHNIINTINSQFEGVKSSLSTEMPKLEQFLNEQMGSYVQTEEELAADLQDVLSRMSHICEGNGVVFSNPKDNGNEQGSGWDNFHEKAEEAAEDAKDNQAMEAQEKQIEDLQKQVADLSKNSFQKANDEFLREAGADNAEFADRFTNDWTNVGEAYQDGLFSGLVATGGATWNTLANGAGYVWNQTVNGAEWLLGAIGLNDLGNSLAWLIS